jgi:phosphatidylglycerophosphate synthase
VIFFLLLLSIAELRVDLANTIWWSRAWETAGPVLVWLTVGLTIYSGLGYAWRHRELIAPDQ